MIRKEVKMKANSIKKNLISIKLLTFLIIANFFLIGSNVELTRLGNNFIKFDIFPAALAKEDKKAEKAAKKEAKSAEKAAKGGAKSAEKVAKKEAKTLEKVAKKEEKDQKKADKELQKLLKKAEKDRQKEIKESQKLTAWSDKKFDQAFEGYAKKVQQAQLKYQEKISKLIEDDNAKAAFKIEQQEDKLANRLAKADNQFIERINSVSKKLEKNESDSLVQSGWVKEELFAKDFTNHGQRVKTYVEIAKAQGLPAYVGALQANFGNPYETGIDDLNKQIDSLNSFIEEANLEIITNQNTISDLSKQLGLAESEVANLIGELNLNNKNLDTITNQIAEINSSLIDEILTDEEVAILQEQKNSLNLQLLELSDTTDELNQQISIVANEVESFESSIQSLDNNITDLETQIVVSEQEIITTEIELVDTIKNIKPGVGQEFEWETVNLDINQDGVVDENDLQA